MPRKHRIFKNRYTPGWNHIQIYAAFLKLTTERIESNLAAGKCHCGGDHKFFGREPWDTGGRSQCPFNPIMWDDTVDQLKAFEGANRHSLWQTWKGMVLRCYDPTSPSFRYYGARGVFIDRWWADFSIFLEDMDPKPSPEYQIDRKDNDKGYFAWNCRWVTKEKNRENTRASRIWYVKGTEYPSLGKAAYANKMPKDQIAFMCNGFTNDDGTVVPPEPDCYSRLTYAKPDGSFDDSRDWPESACYEDWERPARSKKSQELRFLNSKGEPLMPQT